MGREEGREHMAWLEGLGTFMVKPDAPEASPRIPKHPHTDTAPGKPGCSRMVPAGQEEAQERRMVTQTPVLPGFPGLLEQLQAPAGRHRGITQLLTRVRSSPTPWGLCSGRRW